MAVSNENLNIISNKMDSARVNLRNYQNQMEECFASLNSNANYKTFVATTEKGKYLNGILLDLKESGDDVSSYISKLLTATENFVSTQRELNSEFSYNLDPNYEETSVSSSSAREEKANWYQNYYGGGSN